MLVLSSLLDLTFLHHMLLKQLLFHLNLSFDLSFYFRAASIPFSREWSVAK